MTKRRLLLTLISFALSANFLFSQELTFPANNEVYIGDTKVYMEKEVIIIEYYYCPLKLFDSTKN